MIISRTNPKIKNIKKLQKSSKARKEAKVFLVEGSKMVLEAPKNQMIECYCSESFFNRYKEKVEGLGCSYEIVSDELLHFISDTKNPQGILGVIKQRDYTLEEILIKKSPLLLILESIQDPGNLGTIFRTAEAAGATGILMDKDCADIYNPKTIRSTMGAIYRLPHTVFFDTEETIKKIKEAGVCLFATDLKAEKRFDKEDYRSATAFIIGNEGKGLSNFTMNLADKAVKIPMEGKAESLNVAIATSLLVFEAFRQRGFYSE